MNARLLGRTSPGFLLIAVALLSLTGCQLLGSQQSQINDTVVAGTPSLDFGKVGLGNSKTIQNKLTNFKTSSVTIVSITGLDSTVQITGVTLPLLLPPGQEAQFSVVFQPAGAGKVTKTVSFGDNSQFLASIDVTGEGVEPGELTLSPSSVNFGNVKIGANNTGNVTLSNGGTTDVTVTQASLSGAGFTVGNLALPLTLHPGGSAPLSVTFAPTAAGNFSGSVTFSTDAAQARVNASRRAPAQPANVVVLALSGVGVDAGTLSANPTSQAFGNVVVGGNSTKSETLTNTGGSSLTISQANVSGAGFSISGLTLPATLAVNQSVSFTVKFAPTVAGAVSGNLALVSDTSNSTLNIPLTGTGDAPGQLSASPASLAFGNVQIGTSSNKSETLTNNGGTSVTISQANLTGAAYSISGLTLPATLAPNQSVALTVTFSPTAAGAANGTLAIVSDAPGSPLNIGLSGNGVPQGQITPNPVSLTFGNVLVGGSKTLAETLTNSGGTSVTISAASASGAGFSLSGLALPMTLTAGQSTTFSVQFAPTVAGGVSGNVSITSNGANPNLNIALSGNGATPGALSANPASLAFGSVQVGSNASLSETLTNTGGSNVTISQATVTGTGFAVIGLTLPATLTPNQAVTFTVKFAPVAAGNISGNVAIVSDAPGSPLNIALSGTGVAPGSLIANPSSVIFGNVTLGSNKTVAVTVTNSGGSNVTISNAAATGTGFSFSGPTLPVTLSAGQTAAFNAVFTPAAAGSSSGNLTITSDANNPTLTIPLSGVGVSPGQITPNPASLGFGNVAVGSSKTLTETLTNSGGTSLIISAASASGTGFSLSGLSLPLTLTAGQSTTFNVQFAPAATGAASGNVTITSDGSNPTLTIALSGTGVNAGTLSANPASLSFGNVQIGGNASLSETLTNTGGVNVTISQANVTGAGFSVTGLTLPVTLTPTQTVTFSVKFAPAAAGNFSGNLAIVSDAPGSPLNIALSGTGVAPGSLIANPSSVIFGNVTLGSNKTVAVTVTNSGGSNVTISNAAATGTGFSFSGPTLPVTLSAGQTAAFNAVFTPAAAGSSSGNLTITSDANNPTLTIPLSGVGVSPGQITPNPASLGFGNVAVGSSKTLTETLTNSGGTSLIISAASASGTGFSLSGLSLPLTLTAGQSTTFNVQFAPAATGAASGNVTITSDGSNPTLTIALSGTGVNAGTLSANPASLSFGNVQIGGNASLSETLTNTGGVNVTISQANVTGAGFSVTGLTLPVTLTPTQTVTFSVKFAPTVGGAASGNVAVISDASNSPLNIGLSGSGVTPGQITPNPASLSFGSVTVGSSKSLTETLTNSGGSSLTISAAAATGSGYSISGLSLPLTLTAGQSTSFTVQFAPTAAGASSGNVAITSNGSNPNLNIALSGTGVAPGTLSANPASLPFGTVQVGSSANLSETLTNTGGSTVTISQANVTGAGFSISGLTLPTTLTAGQSVTFTATFAPGAVGAVSGNLAVISDASNSTLNIGMSGTGGAPGTLSVTPGTLSFGNVVVGASSALTGTLTATGASVIVSSGSSNSSEFVLSGITFPKTIAAGQSASFTVTFTPNANGVASANLTFVSNASNSPTVEALTGTGQAPLPHSVDLTWNASQTQGVVGYNIYRRTPSGSYGTPLNGSLNASLAYTDNTVAAGQTYFYVARAVDGNNVESGNSNEVQAVIPTP